MKKPVSVQYNETTDALPLIVHAVHSKLSQLGHSALAEELEGRALPLLKKGAERHFPKGIFKILGDYANLSTTKEVGGLDWPKPTDSHNGILQETSGYLYYVDDVVFKLYTRDTEDGRQTFDYKVTYGGSVIIAEGGGFKPSRPVSPGNIKRAAAELIGFILDDPATSGGDEEFFEAFTLNQLAFTHTSSGSELCLWADDVLNGNESPLDFTWEDWSLANKDENSEQILQEINGILRDSLNLAIQHIDEGTDKGRAITKAVNSILIPSLSNSRYDKYHASSMMPVNFGTTKLHELI